MMLGIIGGFLMGAGLGTIVGWLTAQRLGWTSDIDTTALTDHLTQLRSVDQWSRP